MSIEPSPEPDEGPRFLPFPAPPKKKTRPFGKVLPIPLRWPDALNLIAVCRHEQATVQGSRRVAAQKDEIVLYLGLYLGLRVAEMCDIQVEDFDFAERTARVNEGKGAKDRVVPIAAGAVAMLKAWAKKIGSGRFLSNCRRGRFCERVLHNRVQRLGKRAGVPWLHPHTLRHAAALRLLTTGSHIRKIQKFLGHADIRVTCLYLDLMPIDLREDCDRM